MRIVSGSAGGRVLKAPTNADVIRPTSDKVRQALFNVLGQTCDGFAVLDLYAGTGALGLEALSRGAVKAVLVDSGREAQALCKENAQALGFADQVQVLPFSADRAIVKLHEKGEKFELIFADPPYAQQAVAMLLHKLAEHPLLSEGGRLVLEHGVEEASPESQGPFARLDFRAFGDTVVSIYG